MNFCDIIQWDELSLTEQSKDFMPSFCSGDGKIIRYSNANDDFQSYEMEMFHTKTVGFSATSERCDSDTNGTIYFCAPKEILTIRLKSLFDSSEIIIYLTTIINRRNGNENADILSIRRRANLQQTSFTRSFEIVTDEKNFEEASSVTIDFFDQIELGDSLFYDVYSNDLSSETDTTLYKFYYSKEKELLAYQDTAETLWIKQ